MADATRLTRIESDGVWKVHDCVDSDESATPVYDARPGFSESVRSSSGGHDDDGSKRAIVVDTQRKRPGTGGASVNGMESSSAPKSAPSAMAASEKVRVMACGGSGARQKLRGANCIAE